MFLQWNFYAIAMLIVAIAIPVGLGFLGSTFGGGGGESGKLKSCVDSEVAQFA